MTNLLSLASPSTVVARIKVIIMRHLEEGTFVANALCEQKVMWSLWRGGCSWKRKQGAVHLCLFSEGDNEPDEELGSWWAGGRKSEEQHQGVKDKGEETAEFHTFNIKSLPKTKDGEASLMSLVDDIGGMGNFARCWVLVGVMCRCKIKRQQVKIIVKYGKVKFSHWQCTLMRCGNLFL